MRRAVAMLSIVILLFMQSTPSTMQFISATTKDDNQFTVNVDNDATQEKAEIEIKSIADNNFDMVNILLPKESQYHDQLATEQKAVEVTYKEENHSLTIKWDNDQKQNVTFNLIDLIHANNSLTIQGIISDEITIEESHDFTVLEVITETSDQDSEVASDKNNADETDSNDERVVESEDSEPKSESDSSESNEGSKGAFEDSESNDESEAQPVGSKSDLKAVNESDDSGSTTLGDLNTYLGIGPIFETALSGADADFRLTLKLTGSKRTYKNVNVVVDLPLTEYITFDNSQENLDHLAIDGVSPTFDTEKNQLTYHFDEMKRGQMYEKIIALQTTNGYIPDNTSIEVDASITGEVHYTENDEKEEAQKGDIVSFEYTDHGSMDIKASGALSLSKFQVDEGENNKRDSSVVNRGEEVLWKLELEIPKKNRGQLFLNPDEKITITDALPSQLEYVEVISADQPKSIEGNVITWEFSADDFETQKDRGKTLFTKDIVIKTKVKGNAAKGQITNSATASATFINDNQVTDDASRNVLVATDNPSSGEIEGSVVRPAHLGPDPSSGNGLGTNDKKNPNPTVTDDTILRFSHGIAALLESYPDGKNKPAKNFKELQTFYEIDANLNLETMRAPGPFRYQPNNSHPNDEYFDVQPRYDIKAKIDGGGFQTLVAADDVIPGKTYTRAELGLTPEQKVSEIKIEFLKGYNGIQDDAAPGGLRSQYTVLYEFSIDEGYTGTVENKFNITGVNGNNERFDDRVKNPDVYDNSKPSDIAGPRQATVVGYGENPKPVGRVGVKLLEDVRGVVTLGKNRMQVELINVNNSGAPMNSQLETVVLLAPGVTLHGEVNPSYTNAQGEPTDGASYEVLEENYNGSGRQLVKVKWDDSRITKGQNLTAELDVYVAEEAPNQLQFDVYGFSSDTGLQAPSNTEGGITDTVLQTDTEDLNGNGDTNQPRLKSGNIYSLAGKYDVQTEKLIKGPNDEDYSKFTTAPFEGTVDYKLKMTNTTGKDLSIMTLIDVLPTVGDLGITDNINRGSTFDPVLEGPITLPAEWQGKVNVFYSTAKNPERDDLTRNTDYLPNTPQLTNPEGAEAPNWMQESDIADWSTIHSFKIELQKGDTWIKGQDIEIDFSMKMPSEEEVEEAAKNLDLVPHQRAAWNSFAVATDTGQPVEPERVGVALELDPPETPDVEKEVEDNDGEYGKDLVEKEFEKEYNYRVNTEVPENLQGFEYLTLTDTLDDQLDVVDAVALVNGEKVDYEVTIDGQLVTLQLDRTQLDGISGQRLTLQITAKIKEGTEVQIINNKAEIQVNDNPSEESNDVPVNPPPVKPEIEKDIDGEKAEEAVEKLRGEVYEYNVTSILPENVTGYKTVNISDELDDRLTIESTKVLIDGESSDIEAITDGQLVTVSLDEDQIKELAGAEIKLVIAAKINEDVEIEIIDNEASIQVNDDPEINSNVVPVTPPPPATPDVEKEVEGNDGEYGDELVEKEREKEYNYRVNTVVPEDLVGFEHITLADELDERLDVISAVALVDGEEVDYEVTIEDQLVTLRVEREQLDEIAGQELTLQITAQIKAGVEVEVIDNEATIQVNDNPSEDSNKVPVIPPPATPGVEKEVEGNDGEYGKDLVEKELEKEYNYRVNTVVPEDLRGFEHIILADELDDRLDVINAVALVDGTEVDYEVIIEDQLVTLKVDREQLDKIAGQELTLQITAQIKAGVEVEVIDNEATIQVNDNPSEQSNKVPVIPPPEIEKDIDGEKAEEPVEKLRGEEYDYNVTTTLPQDVSGFKTVLISDDLDERLSVVEAKVLVDGETSDIQANIDGQLVTVLLENDQIAPFAGKEIKLVITAKINADVEIEVIDNQASIQVNDNPKVDSNKVPVIPPTTPNIEKDVEGTDHLDIDFNKEYNYNIVTELPSNIKDYEKYIITDNVDPGLVVITDKVAVTVDGETYDGLELTVDGNKVEVVVTDFAGLDGKEQIELVIPAKVHPETNIEDYTDNQIPNTVDLDFTNESGEDSKITTKPVTVTPPPTPDVEKEVEGNDGEYGTDLVEKEREKAYNYRVNTVVPEDLTSFVDLTLADELDERLDVIGAVALVNREEVDYEITIDGQLVTLKLDREQLDEIAGQELTLQITAQIKAGVEVEEIDNQATIQVNNNPTKESNIVPVIPPPETPDVEKQVEDNEGVYGKDLVEKEREKEYNYRVNTVVPEDLRGYEHITLADELDERLDVKGAVALVDGEEVDYEVIIDGQLVTLKVDRVQLDEIAGQELTLQITAQIKAGVEVEVIDNEATIQVNNNPTESSNKVPVIPPPETPNVEKEVEGNDGAYGKELVEKELEKEYNYRVNTIVPEDLRGYEHITLADELDDRLEVLGAIALVDGEEVDYEVIIEDQLVTLRVEREQLDEIAGQELTLQITAQIKAGVEVEVIDNEATIQVNDNPTKESNKVPVIPPPKIEKDIDGEKAVEPVEKLRGQEYDYNVTTRLPEDVSGFETVLISDDLDERLTVVDAKVLVDGETSDIQANIDGQLVTVLLENEEIEPFAGKEIKLVITAKINADVEVEVIDNQASIQVNDNPKVDSNKVPVIPPTTPNIEKDVEGTDHLDIDFNKEYNYNIVTELPSNIKDYERYVITDNVDPGLVVMADQVVATVDGETYDGLELTVDGNKVEVVVTDFAGLDGKEQIELVIPAKIHPDTNIDEYTDNQIPNTVDLDFTNESDEDSKITTKPVTVTPPPTPDVEKEVEDNNGDYGKDLVEKEREKDYNYRVNTVVPEDLTSFVDLTLADELDERLDVKGAVALVNGEEVDYEITIDGQLVTLKLDREQLDEIAGQELTLQITAQIKAGVEVEVIDNEATIQVNDNPSKNSNKVPVIPPPETPDVEKEVEGNDGEYGKNLVEKEREKDYNYRVNTVVPEDLRGYEHITLADELDDRLEVKGAVALVDGEEVDYEVVIDGQLVTLKVDREQLDEIAGQELTLQITAQIKAGVEVEVIDNEATIQVNNNPTENSNKVPVIPPPETPDVEKEVEDNDGEYGKDLVEKERENDYNYRVNTVVPEDLRGYEHITLADELDQRLDVKGAVALVNGEEVDYEITIDGQLVTLKLDRAQLDEIAGQELTLQITAQIKAGVEVEVIDNEATIQVNDNPTKNSNKVPVIPPPETPDVEKEVEGNDGSYGKELVEKKREKDYNYRVNTVIPDDLRGYEHITLADELDERLEVMSAVALVNGEEVDYEVIIDGQLVTLKVDREQLDEIAGQELTLQITAQIKAGVEVEIIDNQATIQVNDNPTENSNVVPVIPEDPPRLPTINKDVEGMDHLDIDYDKEYQYNIITKLPSNIEDYEAFVITDTVDKGLEVISEKVTVTVDGEAYDGLVLTVDGNNVKVEVTDFAGLKGKEQIELVITAKIHPDTNMDDYVDNKIPNTATLEFTNESGEEGQIETKPVTVTPPTPEDPGSELPKTATNTFNLQLIGLGIILVGLLLLFVRRKRI